MKRNVTESVDGMEQIIHHEVCRRTRGGVLYSVSTLLWEELMPLDFEALDHALYMRAALKEAERSLADGDRPIGAVIVHNGKIVGRGRAMHKLRHSQIAHAEMNALMQAERYLEEHQHEAVLYTTVEPCVMCLGAAVMSDLAAIVFALADKNIHPEAMLEMPYVKRHIKHYLGGVLRLESEALWVRGRPDELRMLNGG